MCQSSFVTYNLKITYNAFFYTFFQFVYVGLTKGWNSSKKEFSDRVFNALSLKRTSSQAKDKSEKDVTEANDGACPLEENGN